jgi:uncharacterized protein YggU (UPF0235/DUF167 family)
VRLAVRLAPKASRNRIEGVVAEADGGHVLKVSVTAVPEDGKANAALIKLLAKEWKLPKSAFDIAQGATDRRKSLFISGEPEELRRRIEQWITDHDG